MTPIAPRVLIVDDEPQLLRGLKIMLRTAGYVVETARTALDMLAILAAHPPDYSSSISCCRTVRASRSASKYGGAASCRS